MKYYKSSQMVPGKGIAWTFYELNEKERITRMLTAIFETNEITLYPKPRLKTLFEPERLAASDENEFNEIWQKGGGDEL